MDNWWSKNTVIPFKNANFQRILGFYLFSCPVLHQNNRTRVSQRGLTFEERGITDRSLTKLLSEMKAKSASGTLLYQCLGTGNNDFVQIEQQNRAHDLNFEMVIFVENSDLKKTRTIFYAIRNALAHGSFSVSGTGEKRTYCLENRNDGVLKARIRLREKTLLNWIELVEKPELWEKQKSEKKNKKRMPALV